MATITLRMSDEEKRELDAMVDEMGMNISTFFMVYAKRALRDRKIPFDITAPVDSFYSEKNMNSIREASQQIKEGKIVVKTMEELEAMANE